MTPPRMAPGQRGGSPYPATQQRGGTPRGRGGARGGGAAGRQGGPSVSVASVVEAIGVRRPGFGTAGRATTVRVNACEMNVPDITVYHYDAIDKTLRAAFNMQLIEALQAQYPDVFIKAAVYDGKKNLYTSHWLDFGTGNSRQFNVTMTEGARVSNFKITVTEAREINMEVLSRYTAGQQSWDENISTALTALNIVIRMAPSLTYPFRVRSFYSDKITAPLANTGLEAWQGYFQSVRPALNRLIVNVDISTGVMFKPGSLVETCLEFFTGNRKSNPDRYLRTSGPQALPPTQRHRLHTFLFGLKVEAESAAGVRKKYSIHKLSERDAISTVFTPAGGAQTNVAQYYAQANRPLRYANIICIQTAKGAVIPLERCYILPGQISRAELSPDATRAMVEFATKKPDDRLRAIQTGIQVLAYGQSRYVRDFGLDIKSASLPMDIPARILNVPELKYGQGSKQQLVRPKDGSWNLVDKKFFRPMPFGSWMVVIFVPQNRFSPDDAKRTITELVRKCEAVGMLVQDKQPLFVYKNPQSNIDMSILDAVTQCRNERKTTPTFIVCILPDGSITDLYTAVKHCGDVRRGVANQCLRVGKCQNARDQYWSNVALKINAKLGGVNVIPAAATLSDPRQPTIVMGADVMHPAPGSQTPSYAAVVASIDSNGARYIAKTTLQLGRQEMIGDLRTMAKDLLLAYMSYRTSMEKVSTLPKRLIFFRDGVSEGEFKRVLDLELPLLQGTDFITFIVPILTILAACVEAKMNPPPKITFIIVGKRHHMRFFPKNPNDRDKSGNLPPGTVIDQEITNPVEFDFYLQSHGGLLGTSKSSHYNVVYDEFGFTPDALQLLAYTLCFTYARSTRSVSIPTPVYYAHIVCSRAKTHYDPQAAPSSVVTGGSQTREETLDKHRGQYQPVHDIQSKRMYFMVSDVI
ncbi:eukaryotic translation initiation factor 2C [Guyanagaster necrorhizus]|uniref:Eukaryotic translation initiation factor 2C n=1 Tax=Guyanagaster necrorhizus TaxID=856835 RepID=A0A9P8AL58_9AGAR|nr:eukaryotic translation initiation factor 2C [Guyanagaster necrorhizus MCA 3950]KAG7439281.1 eukaryotic translation initiation factor 2C [Guyanagaster necrorhizus MCA 3950]